VDLIYTFLEYDLTAKAGDLLIVRADGAIYIAKPPEAGAPMPVTPQVTPNRVPPPTNRDQVLKLLRADYTVRDAARVSGVPKGTIARWRALMVAQGLIPPGKIGRRKGVESSGYYFRTEETLASAKARGAQLAATMKARRQGGGA
jgi:hypothetical protein